ncbi:hypothetical protein L1987_63340 [Smallanthus sonchifolius]|uniref:Uncharacterized protein n=1 Tax=Smallanthus sonchifolius TaxID=185202 RepID=A0ACB9CD05_9ASTR|nr:hypothetical protein L1987_63340 [Smallanthus sonchifolius]
MSHPLSLLLLLLLPFFFLTALPAQPDSSTYPSCRSYNCSDVAISYPFWTIGRDSAAQVCGYHGFGIKCVNNRPEITLGEDSYYVQRINHENRSIVLADRDVFSDGPGPNKCPRVRHGINLETLPLNFSMNSVNLSFHFNCNGFPPSAIEIPCFERIEGKSCVHVMNNNTEETGWEEYSCSQEVVTTVIKEHIDNLPNLSTQFGEILERGFQLQWDMNMTDECEKCEESYGRCGHDNTTGFKCFCSDGTIKNRCCKVDSASLPTNSTTCVPQNCGNGPNITSPFWIPQQQPPSCGSPQFNITCKNHNPIIIISNQDYVIKHIFHNNHSFVLVSAHAFNESNLCPTPLTNFSLDATPFSFAELSTDLYFFYNCSSPYKEETYLVDCASNGTKFSSFAVFHPEILEKHSYSIDSCQSLVHVPVHVDNLNVLLHESYIDVLRKGFVLEWKCSNCEELGKSTNLKLKLGIGLGSAGFAVLVMGLAFCFWRRHNNKRRYYGSSYRSRNISSYTSSMTDPEKNGTYHGVQIFKYRELEKATNHFDCRNELGDGGFGTVYQGKLKDGRVVAVKRLYENNYRRVEQFINEVGILAHLRHRNLVSLYGCTTHHSRELLLVYEYIPNGTVADHLHGEKANPGSLTWSTRMCIAIETASALVYLHASDVVHRDVKTNNILLDNSFTVKVADFGLSRLFPNNVTHVSTAPQGTPGYVDPEYHECYQLTNKSDVYSFGVVLVELISSKPAVDITRHRHEINLSSMALNKIQNDALHELVDPHLGYETEYEVRKMINAVAELAFQCLQNDRDCRPSMDEVLESLMGIQNGMCSKDKQDVLDDDAVLLKNYSQNMSPDSVAVAWSTSTMSISSG